MYWDRELTRLAAHKAGLRRTIALRRAECFQAATQVARPLAWLDRVIAFWHRLHPLVKFAALPLGILVQRAVVPRRGLLGRLARWGPLAFGVLRAVSASARSRRETAPLVPGQG